MERAANGITFAIYQLFLSFFFSNGVWILERLMEGFKQLSKSFLVQVVGSCHDMVFLSLFS